MRVDSLTVTGYRRLANHQVTFGEGLNLIVGPNNSGKTSLLQAIAVLVGTGDAGHPGDNWARDQTSTGGAGLEAVLRPSEEEWRAACALLNAWERRLEPGADCEPKAHAHIASWPSGLLARVTRDPRGKVHAAFEMLPVDQPRMQRTHEHAGEHRLADLARCLGDAFYRRNFSRRTLVDPVYLGGGARQVGPAEAQLAGIEEYGRQHSAPGGRLSEYINLMTEEQRADYARALERVISPEFFVATQFDSRVARLRMTVQDAPGWLLDADWQGSGPQWVMVILAALYGPSWGPVLIDEIEGSLHADLAVRLAALIREEAIRLEKQVIATTHSDLVIADADPQEIILMRQDDLGRWAGQSYLPGDESGLEDALDAIGVPAIGYSRRHLLGVRVVVAVEGETDLRLLEALARKAGFVDFLRAGAAVVPLGGSDRVQRAALSAKLLKKAHLYPKTLVCVIDRDERREDEITADKASAAPAVLHVLGRREIENYLLDAEAIVGVMRTRARRCRDELTAPLVEAKLNELADSWHFEVRSRRTVRRLLRKEATRGQRAFARELERNPAATREEFDRLIEYVDDETDRCHARATWDEVGEVLEGAWETRRLALAPGSKVLKAFRVWSQGRFGYAPRSTQIADHLAGLSSDIQTLFDTARAGIDAKEQADARRPRAT